MLAVKVNAGHDRNGNPLRGWIVFGEQGIVAARVEEGYEGSEPLRLVLALLGAPETKETGEEIQISKQEYRRWFRTRKPGFPKCATSANVRGI